MALATDCPPAALAPKKLEPAPPSTCPQGSARVPPRSSAANSPRPRLKPVQAPVRAVARVPALGHSSQQARICCEAEAPVPRSAPSARTPAAQDAPPYQTTPTTPIIAVMPLPVPAKPAESPATSAHNAQSPRKSPIAPATAPNQSN